MWDSAEKLRIPAIWEFLDTYGRGVSRGAQGAHGLIREYRVLNLPLFLRPRRSCDMI